jgi:hypothetical protein
MTRLLLEIPQESDLNILLPLLKRLKIKFKRTDNGNLSIDDKSHQEALDLIMKGLPEKENLEEWMREFNENRQDRLLPNRD